MWKKVVTKYRTPGGTVYRPYLNLAERPHLLIGGATGSGKSVVLNGIIYCLIRAKSPFEAQFVLIDPKKVELIQYKDLPHTALYASDPPEMLRALQWCITETEYRYQYMQRKGQKEYDGPRLYVILDELADLMTTHKKEALPLLQRLAQIGRAAHVHVIACTQTVLSEIIPTVLKCNFTTIVGLRTATKAQSRYLIEAYGCETLPDPKREGKGYGYVRDGADLSKIMIHKFPEEQIQEAIDWWTSSKCVVETEMKNVVT